MTWLRTGLISPVTRNLIHASILPITTPPRRAFYGTPAKFRNIDYRNFGRISVKKCNLYRFLVLDGAFRGFEWLRPFPMRAISKKFQVGPTRNNKWRANLI